MNGRIVGGFIVIAALAAGAFVYYQQVYAYYRPVQATSPAATIELTPLEGGTPEPMLMDGFQGIDADSSPLRFRACFRTRTAIATLTETYVVYDQPTPTIAPGWFSCFDAERIGTDLESGAAVAFLSQRNIHPGVDRVVAVYPDGRAFAWQQLNDPAGSAGEGTGN
jgi:hypothetical protein